MSRFNNKVTAIQLEDGAGVTIDCLPTQGDWSCSNLHVSSNAEAMEARSRGVHDGFFLGDDLVQEWTMTLEVRNESLTHASSARLYDWIVNHRKGVTSLTNIETSASGAWAFKLRVTCTDGTNTQSVLLPKTTAEIRQRTENGQDATTFTLSGKNVTLPVVT